MTHAIKTDGTLWAWGADSFGSLGNNTNSSYKSSPIQIGALTDWENVVSAGGYSVLASKTDGTLWAWGNNTNGPLGDGTITHKSSPIQVGSKTYWSQNINMGGGADEIASVAITAVTSNPA